MSEDLQRRMLTLLSMVYLLATALLGFRQHIDSIRPLLYGSNVGAYNMFTASVRAQERVFLSGPRGEMVIIPHRQYFWRNRFISTTHSYLAPEVVQRFAEFLSDRPEIREAVRGRGSNDAWKVIVQVRYSRNGGPWQQVMGWASL